MHLPFDDIKYAPDASSNVNYVLFCGWCEEWSTYEINKKQQSKCYTWTESGTKNVPRPSWSDVGQRGPGPEHGRVLTLLPGDWDQLHRNTYIKYGTITLHSDANQLTSRWAASSLRMYCSKNWNNVGHWPPGKSCLAIVDISWAIDFCTGFLTPRQTSVTVLTQSICKNLITRVP